ncbi:MAG TPA: thioesterase family protein [Terriglobia bacterium]|nr:thioesterase family protein [Terriglobia bacterium]
MPSEFRLKRRVQFYETDMAGIVHFSWYFRYMEEAEHALWRSAGLSIADPDSGVGWPRVAVSFEYFRPLRFEDEFEICLRVTSISEKALHFSCDLFLGDARVAAGKMTTVCVTREPGKPMRSTAIPPEIAARFQVWTEAAATREGQAG